MRQIVICMALVAMLAGFSLADFTGSFLSQGTYGLFKNEADKAVGEGTFNGLGYFTSMDSRIGLYTNFINGQGGNEQILGNVSNNKYFLGTSGNLIRLLEKLNTSVFLELDNTTRARAITSKINANTANGYLSQTSTSFDAVSNQSEAQSEENTNEQITKQNSWLINNTYGLAELLKVGLLVSWQGNSLEDTHSPFAAQNVTRGNFIYAANDPDFSYSYNNGLTSRNTSGDFSIKANSPVTRLATGLNWSPEIFSLDGYLGFQYVPFTGDSVADYSYTQNNQSTSIAEKENQTSKGESNLKTFMLGTRLSKGFLNDRLKAAGTLQGGIITGALDYSKSIGYNLFDLTRGPLLNTTATTGISEHYSYSGGDRSGAQTGLCLSLHFAIEDNLDLGLGFGYVYSSLKDSYTLLHSRSMTETFNDGDNQLLDADDWTRNTSFKYLDSRDVVDSKNSLFSFPVGFIWDANQKWQLRAGALHQISKTRSMHESSQNGSATVIATTTYGDGTTNVINSTANPQVANSYVDGNPSNRLTSTTTFTYGVGYHPMQNLNIDVNAMFRAYAGNDGQDLFLMDLDWYRSLWLSLTFFFDPVKRQPAGSSLPAVN